MAELVEALGWDPVERCFQNLKSQSSLKPRMKILQNFFAYHKMSAVEFILLARRTPVGEPQFKIEKMIMDFLDYRYHSNRARSTVAKEAIVIENFFRTNSFIIMAQRKYTSKSDYESTRVLTQKEVKKMIQKTKKLEEKAIICLEAQTAQRVGILTALRFDMIHRYPQKDGKVYGIIEVKPEISDPKGRPVGNKTRAHYKFGVHWQSMMLIDRMRAKADDKNGWIWHLGFRGMERVITDAAMRAGIQKAMPTRIPGRIRNDIHAHVFRRFWMARMNDAKVTTEYIRDYQIGHSINSQTYYWGTLTEEKIIKAMKKADKYLRVLA